jgi:hypothetical protein
MAVKMSVLVFWLVMPCEFVGRYQHFGGIPPKRWYLATNPHGITTQKTNNDIQSRS